MTMTNRLIEGVEHEMREVELVRRRNIMAWDRTKQGGHNIRLAVIGHHGAVSFTYVPDLPCWDEVKAIMKTHFGDDEFYRKNYTYPQGVDLSYHSRVPIREWQVSDEEADGRPDEFLAKARECDLLGGLCWTDGSITTAQGLSPVIQEGGEDAIYDMLASYYHSVFYEEDGDPAEPGFGDVMSQLMKALS